MFGLLRTTLRAFAAGAIVGVLFAPRAGAETRKMLSERFASSINSLLEIAALPPIQPARLRRLSQPSALARPKAVKQHSPATESGVSG